MRTLYCILAVLLLWLGVYLLVVQPELALAVIFATLAVYTTALVYLIATDFQ